MFFSVGVCPPENKDEAWGMIVPALCNDAFSCHSAADSQEDMPVMVTEAILLVVEEMVLGGYGTEQIHDAGFMGYADNPEYSDFTVWFMVNVDLSPFEGKQQRINIALPDTLIQRIDNRVKESGHIYRDRSHFLAEAARHELAG